MKALITGFIFLLTSAHYSLNSIYDVSINTIEGSPKQLNELQGKKIMLVILPVTHTAEDSTFLISLDSLSRAKADAVAFIAVCSYEDGFADSLKTGLTNYYRALLGNQIIITDGMHTRKNQQQHPLFEWLTKKENNTHFDDDAGGPGQKFFINEQGELYGVYGAEVPLTGRHVLRMLQ